MAAVTSRDELSEHCLRRLGAPVIDINVDPDQVEDRIDEALQFFQEFHSDATLRTYFKHLITADDVTNEYITMPNNIDIVSKLFPVSSSSNNSIDMFSVKYQMMLNDITDLQNFAGDLAYYTQLQQYLTLIDMKLNGLPQVQFSRHQHRLYIFGDFKDNDIKAGDYIVAEVYQLIDPDTHTSVYNDKFVKAYTTALIKRQWGANLIKFEGMQLPGGVMLNGRQIFEDAMQDIEKLEENMRLEHEMPADFFVG
jgi:hypothetical protein